MSIEIDRMELSRYQADTWPMRYSQAVYNARQQAADQWIADNSKSVADRRTERLEQELAVIRRELSR